MFDKPFSIFCFEDQSIDSQLSLLRPMLEDRRGQLEARGLRLDFANSLGKATELVDYFKAHFFGGVYDLALINLNDCSDPHALEFLLNPHVLGDPPVVLLASRQGIVRWPLVYARARRFINDDHRRCRSGGQSRPPSCFECYSIETRQPCIQTILNHIELHFDSANHSNSRRPSTDRIRLSLLRTPVNSPMITLESLD